MNLNVNNARIAQKFLALSLLILFSVVVSYSIVFWFNDKQKMQGIQIDVAGRNRMLSQRIAAMALLADNRDEAAAGIAKEELKKVLKLHEESLKVLKEGGIAPGIEGNIELPAAPNSIASRISEVQSFFAGYKAIVNVILEEPRMIQGAASADTITAHDKDTNPKFQEAVAQIREGLINGKLLKMNMELTQLFSQQATEAKNSFTWLIWILLAVNITVVALAFFFLRSTVKPIEDITQQIHALSNGEVPPPLDVKRGDEIGTMGTALNVLSHQLGMATEFAKNVGNGNLDTSVEVFGGNGDLSQSLYAMRKNLKRSVEEDTKRNWAAEGLAQFSDILRTGSDVKTLAGNILSHLVKYTRSNQGGLFILNDTENDDVHLELVACYAFDRKKFMSRKIGVGEGLVGQAFLEKATIYMKEVPKDYVRITSGLGDGSPKAVLIVPLKINDTIEGIIELASFSDYQPYEIAFIEKLSENIASTIAGVKTNERTQLLLRASQQQSEELRSQEEEMRQNMEELEATQEEMGRKEREYLARIESLQMQLTSMGINGNGSSATEQVKAKL